MSSSLRFIIALLLAFSLVACSSDDDDDGKPRGNLRFINSLSDVLPVDVIKDCDISIGDLGALSASEYESYTSVPHAFQINIAETYSQLWSDVLLVPQDTDNTFVLYVTVKKTRAFVLRDNNSRPPSDRSRLRFVNAASTPITVDAYVNRLGLNTPPSVRNLTQRQASEYIDGNTGSFYFSFKNSRTGETVATSLPYELTDSQIRTIVLAQRANGYAVIVALDAD